jgi:hypothetical protein
MGDQRKGSNADITLPPRHDADRVDHLADGGHGRPAGGDRFSKDVVK